MEVSVYSVKGCGWCTRQKKFFLENGIAFEEKDIENKKYLNELQELGGTGTPFTVVKESGKIVTLVTGFNKEELSELLLQR